MKRVTAINRHNTLDNIIPRRRTRSTVYSLSTCASCKIIHYVDVPDEETQRKRERDREEKEKKEEERNRNPFRLISHDRNTNTPKEKSVQT